eukprot:scaffold31315_cov49-Attheya_sp.AAC.3
MKRPGEDGDQASKRLREEQQDAFAHDMAQLNAAAMMEAERRQQQQQHNPGVVHRIEDLSSDESSSHQHNNNSMTNNNTSMMSDEESILLMEGSRSHRAWLHAPTAGPRRPRVGHDFQVWALPVPPPAPTHRPPLQQQQQQVNDPDRDTAGTNNNHHHNHPAPAQHLESDAVHEDGGGHWLSATHGERHPRIGADYQASLPGPQIR